MIKLNAQAYTARNRNEMIFKVEEQLSKCESWILDFKMFSNKAINFIVETKTTSLNSLVEKLLEIDLKMHPEAFHKKVNLLALEKEKTVRLFFVLNFVNGNPDLEIEVPSVPG